MRIYNLALYLPRHLSKNLHVYAECVGFIKINDLNLEVTFLKESHEQFMDKETYPNIDYLVCHFDLPTTMCETSYNTDITLTDDGSDNHLVLPSFWSSPKVRGLEGVMLDLRKTDNNRDLIANAIKSSIVHFS